MEKDIGQEIIEKLEGLNEKIGDIMEKNGRQESSHSSDS